MMIKNKETLKSWLLIVIAVLFLVFFFGTQSEKESKNEFIKDIDNLEQIVLPKAGVILPIEWKDFGKKMVEEGIIDGDLLESIYKNRGGLNEDELSLLYGDYNGNIIINLENSNFILNLLWAFGLSNKNPILEEGEMTNPKYRGANRFASTGGWTIAKGNSMDYYSKYDFIVLTKDQQALVERVSKNIYRPCCDNSTYFPDCNHGMAMLGLLELLAKENLSESEIYDIALQVNAYWFPDTYLNLAKYFLSKDLEWRNVDSKEVLGNTYSSLSGYMKVLESIEPIQLQRGGSCGV